HRAPGPRVQHVDDQRSVHRNGRMKARWRLPCAIANAAHPFSARAGRMQRQAAAIASHDVSIARDAVHLHLQPFHRRIDVARRAPGARLLAEYVSWLGGLAKLDLDADVADAAQNRVAKFEMRREPIALERIARPSEIIERVAKI